MTLWMPTLFKAVASKQQKRFDTHRAFDYLRILKYGIIHHIPIFNRQPPVRLVVASKFK
ncbi:hypothetical protein METHB2_680011 [Candidatus Methylobacter favarea]|uniref:Uncharacterized protein n=1 Tax=Candidatus Methylobacter favarea TaxID=2707345 RepID=A0A8S0WRZ2_9GAMM|nr:hypothetical protein METHB2_680011 [Candidatus Methylobacter favarea]